MNLLLLLDSKNGLPMYAFCNSVAREVVNRQRGRHPEYVFVHEGHRISKMNNTAWKTAARWASRLSQQHPISPPELSPKAPFIRQARLLNFLSVASRRQRNCV